MRAGLYALPIAALFTLSATFVVRLLDRKSRGHSITFQYPGELDQLTAPSAERWILGAGLLLLVALLVRRRGLLGPRAVIAALVAGVGPIAAAVLLVHGHFVAIAIAAIWIALLVGLHLPAVTHDPFSTLFSRRDRFVTLGLWLLVAAIHALYSMHRYANFGAGSWDLGCMIHNFYRASRFLDSTSSVLGDVDFLGDHFMIGIYLYAPIYWIDSSGYTLLAIQALNVSAAAPAAYGIARDRGAAPTAAAALALAAGFAFGIQSASYFDSHEITVGFGFLAFGLWAFERGWLGRATILFGLFALFKESLGAYVVALGLLAIWRGLRDHDRRSVRFGLAWIVLGAVWFVLVNRVFMPALIARANAPEPHETFADFGPTVFSALLGILKNPLKAIGAVFVPSAEKVASQMVTLGGVGWLALLAPEVLIAAAPLIAERFLSSKSTMWEMGYHYAAPLSLYAAWAAALGWPRIERAAERALVALGDTSRRAERVLAVYLIASAALINTVGYRHQANFHRWNVEYFSTPERKKAHRGAIDFLKKQPREARLAVQNRILPHLADRPFVYRLGDYGKADWVLLSVGENAWPWDDHFPRQLAGILKGSPEWRLVYSAGGTAVFARVAKTPELPAVAPAPELGVQ